MDPKEVVVIDSNQENQELITPAVTEPNYPESLGFAQIFKAISTLALPTAASYTFSIQIFLILLLLNSLNDDEEHVAASTLIALLMNTFIAIGASPLFAMSVITSHEVGALEDAQKAENPSQELLERNRKKIASINHNGFWLSGLISIPLLALINNIKPLLMHMGQDEEVSEVTQQFLQTYSPAIPALLLRIATEQMLFSFKKANAAMNLGLMSLGLGTGASLLLAHGKMGFPKLGARGIALGYVIESYMTATFFALYLAKHPDFKLFSFFKVFQRTEIQFNQFKKLLSIGSTISNLTLLTTSVNKLKPLIFIHRF